MLILDNVSYAWIDVALVVSIINSDGTTDKYVLENEDGTFRTEARSFLGTLYFSTEHGDNTYLVNETEDGVFPAFINSYRHPGEDGNFIHE